MPTSFSIHQNQVAVQPASLPIPDGELVIRFQSAADQPANGITAGPVGEVSLVIEAGQPVLLVSLGKPEKMIVDTYRQAGGKLADWLVKHPTRQASLDAEQIGDAELAAFCEGVLLNAFRFERYKQKDAVDLSTIFIRAENRLTDATRIVTHANLLVGAVNLERDWAHEPANRINPVSLAERAVELAETLGIKCTILDDHELNAMGAGAITAVGKGSQTPSRMIIMEYPGRGKGVGTLPVTLVGKAITFDTGGYSLKDTINIRDMKYDKCGGLNVLAIMKAAVDLQLETPLIGVVCAAENMISGGAYRPDDILTSLSGKTIEIITTDAEGRLVLADGLTYVQRNFKSRSVIDMATLTGGVVTALGRVRAGLMSNDDELAAQLSAAGEATHERLWRLPLDEDYFTQIKGDDADIKNSGGKEAHPVIGGMFLKQFVEEGTKWAHLDIAGVADVPKDMPYSQKGATGFGIRLIVNYLEGLE